MKKYLSCLVLVAIVFLMPIVLAGCGEGGVLQAENITRIFGKGENFEIGELAQVKIVDDDSEEFLDEGEYNLTTNYNSAEEGIYNVTITVDDLQYAYEVVVIDFSALSVQYGGKLGDIALPSALSLEWKDSHEGVGSVGTNMKVAYFTDSNGQTIEVTLPVCVLENQNYWITQVTIEDWIYGQTPSTPYASALIGDVEYSYYTNQNGEKGERLANIPTEAGDYFIEASVTGVEGYGNIFSQKSFKIEKATISVQIDTQNIIEKDYDGTSIFNDNNFSINDYVTLSCQTADIEGFDFQLSHDLYFVADETTGQEQINAGNCFLKATLNMPASQFENFQFENGQASQNIFIPARINKQTPQIDQMPIASAIISGQTLSESNITGGVVTVNLIVDGVSQSKSILGSWQWQNPEQVAIESGNYQAIFIPTDKNFSSVTQTLSVTAGFDDEVSAYITDDFGETIASFVRDGNNFILQSPQNIDSFNIVIDFASGLDAVYTFYYDEELYEIDFPYFSGDILSSVTSFEQQVYSKIRIELTLTDYVDSRTLIFEILI